MTTYILYRRVSTKDQGKSGLGLEAQQRDIAIFLENYAEKDHSIAAEFTEVDSGADNDRPQLAAAIALAKKTGAILLVSKLDRLSRKVSFIAALMEDAKVNFKVASMPFADNFQLHIYAALAEQERQFISSRTKAALKEAKARGKILGGLRDKTGQRNKARELYANAAAEKLRGLVMPLKNTGHTLNEIADALTRAGVTPHAGGKWAPTQVMRVINRLKAAEIKHD